MTTPNDRSAAMADGRRADSQRRRQRVAKALQTVAASDAEVSISAIARAAGVDRSFFYRPQHRDLLAAVQAAASEPRDSVVGPAASRASLQADLANSQDRCKRLADHVSLLEKRLSAAIGEEVWSRSGLGSSIDVEDLHRQILTLEETNADLRLKMEDLEEELAAARANNRELMTQFNAKGRAPR
jgi:chromosome segregation ATPase